MDRFSRVAKLQFRTTAVATVTVIIIILISAWLASRYVEQQTRVSRGKTLAAVTDLTHQAILTWVHENQGTAKIWARDERIIALAEDLLTVPREREALLASPSQRQMRQVLANVVEARHFRGYFLIAPDNMNLSSTRDHNLGVKNLLTNQPQVLARARGGEIVVSLPQISDVALADYDGVLREGLPTMFVVSPIRNRDNTVIALLAFRIDPRGEFADILAHGTWGETGITFVFDAQARLLNESHHAKRLRKLGALKPGQDSVFDMTLSPPTQPTSFTRLAKMALASPAQGSGLVLDGYVNVVGDRVLGAWHWDPELAMGIAAEINEDEALRNFNSVLLTIWTMAGLLCVGLVLMLYLFRYSNRQLDYERRRFKELADYAHDMISRHDADGVVRYMSPACTRILGYSRDELVGRSPYELFHEDDLAAIRQSHQHVQTHPTAYVVAYRIRHKSGHYVWLETTSSSIRGSDGRFGEIISISRDITERKNTETALVESEARYRALFENMQEGIVIHDHTGTIVTVNPQALNILKLTEDQLLGRASLDLGRHTIRENGTPFPPDEYPAVLSLRTGQPHSAVIMGIHQHHDMISWISINSRAIERDGIPVYVLVSFRDITEQRKNEQEREKLRDQLQQSQKLRALGQLTGGIAHDFNNILAGIQGYTELIAMMQTDNAPETTRNYLSQIIKATERAGSLVQQLLLFSRNKHGKPTPTMPATIAKEVVTMLQPAFSASIQFKLVIDRNFPRLMIDPTQLHQVITNLCINARDAMHGKGEIGISVTRQFIMTGQCTSCRQAVHGDWIVIDVVDTGHGVRTEVMERIFEPFFTTKEVGKGSGMGLAMVHGIVHEYGGHIVVTSTVGRGSSFRLLFPVLNEETQANNERSTMEENAAT